MVKTYAVELMAHKEPTYITEPEVMKLVKQTNSGARLVLVGKTFINPASIARIRRVYDVDASVVEEQDPEMIAMLESKEVKRLN